MNIYFTTQFKRDYKKLKKQRKNLDQLKVVIEGFIRFVRETLSGPWLDPLWVRKRLAAQFQLRLI